MNGMRYESIIIDEELNPVSEMRLDNKNRVWAKNISNKEITIPEPVRVFLKPGDISQESVDKINGFMKDVKKKPSRFLILEEEDKMKKSAFREEVEGVINDCCKSMDLMATEVEFNPDNEIEADEDYLINFECDNCGEAENAYFHRKLIESLTTKEALGYGLHFNRKSFTWGEPIEMVEDDDGDDDECEEEGRSLDKQSGVLRFQGFGGSSSEKAMEAVADAWSIAAELHQEEEDWLCQNIPSDPCSPVEIKEAYTEDWACVEVVYKDGMDGSPDVLKDMRAGIGRTLKSGVFSFTKIKKGYRLEVPYRVIRAAMDKEDLIEEPTEYNTTTGLDSSVQSYNRNVMIVSHPGEARAERTTMESIVDQNREGVCVSELNNGLIQVFSNGKLTTLSKDVFWRAMNDFKALCDGKAEPKKLDFDKIEWVK